MALAPSIFISATSSDLHSARDVVAKILTAMGYTPVWQDMAATDAGDLREVLYSRIKPCAAVIQLVGLRYGAEPRQADAEFGHASYTQLEALYAEKIGKKVIYIFLPPDFPTDPSDPESEEKAQLQAAYRQRLSDSGVLRHSASNLLELENRVLRIRDDLALLRAEIEKSRRRLWVAAGAGIILLGGIAWGVWNLTKSSADVKTGISGIKKMEREQHESLDHLKQDAEKQGLTSARIEAKIDEIRALPANLRADRLGEALASANADELFALRAAGITISEIENALGRSVAGSDRKIANAFFNKSRRVPRAIEWFKGVLRDGLDPNLAIPHPYFENRAILMLAMKNGNAPAALALLEAGASPHPYQGLWLTTDPIPAFLFPYSWLTQIEEFDATEKKSLAVAMRKAGAAITRFEPGVNDVRSNRYTDSVSEQREEVEKIFRLAPDTFGFKLEETPALGQTNDSIIAQSAGKPGEPWRKFIQEMPLRLISEERPDWGPFWVEIRNFIGAYFDRGYFLAVAFDYADGPEYALVEISKDYQMWNVYQHIGTRWRMGFAKNDKGEEVYGDNQAAWRKFGFRYYPEKNEMMLRDDYKYKTTRDLNAPLKPL
jgi:hypothetical protein